MFAALIALAFLVAHVAPFATLPSRNKSGDDATITEPKWIDKGPPEGEELIPSTEGAGEESGIGRSTTKKNSTFLVVDQKTPGDGEMVRCTISVHEIDDQPQYEYATCTVTGESGASFQFLLPHDGEIFELIEGDDYDLVVTPTETKKPLDPKEVFSIVQVVEHYPRKMGRVAQLRSSTGTALRTIRVIRCVYADANSIGDSWRDPPPSRAKFEKAAFEDADAWSKRLSDASYNKVRFSRSFPSYTWQEVLLNKNTPVDCSTLDQNAATNECNAAAVAAAPADHPSNSDHTLYLLSRQWCGRGSRGIAGQANTWCGNSNCPSWYFGIYGADAGVVAHEFGHNLGLHHAGAGGTEYGDPLAIMGSRNPSYGDFLGLNKLGAHFLSPLEVDAIGLERRTVALKPVHLDPAGNTYDVVQTCENTCVGAPAFASDGECDDGGEGRSYSFCNQGTDCEDCGSRPLVTRADDSMTYLVELPCTEEDVCKQEFDSPWSDDAVVKSGELIYVSFFSKAGVNQVQLHLAYRNGRGSYLKTAMTRVHESYAVGQMYAITVCSLDAGKEAEVAVTPVADLASKSAAERCEGDSGGGMTYCERLNNDYSTAQSDYQSMVDISKIGVWCNQAQARRQSRTECERHFFTGTNGHAYPCLYNSASSSCTLSPSSIMCCDHLCRGLAARTKINDAGASPYCGWDAARRGDASICENAYWTGGDGKTYPCVYDPKAYPYCRLSRSDACKCF